MNRLMMTPRRTKNWMSALDCVRKKEGKKRETELSATIFVFESMNN